MNDPKHQVYPDGTRVRFTHEAQLLRSGKGTRPGSKPLGHGRLSDPRGTYTITNTDDNLHDVILNEVGERWGITWLEEVVSDD